MNKLWQLKKLSTNENLNEPQLLPKNWGPIFGLNGFIDKLDNLEWLGEEYQDMGWFVVGEVSDDLSFVTPLDDEMWSRAKQMLKDSDWSVLPDVPMIAQKYDEWIIYRRKLREIKLQPGFPDEIDWPEMPD